MRSLRNAVPSSIEAATLPPGELTGRRRAGPATSPPSARIRGRRAASPARSRRPRPRPRDNSTPQRGSAALNGESHRRALGARFPPAPSGARGRQAKPHASPADRAGRGASHWWAVTVSNRRPSRCKRDALPTELTALARAPQSRVIASAPYTVAAEAKPPRPLPRRTRRSRKGRPAAALPQFPSRASRAGLISWRPSWCSGSPSAPRPP